MLAEFCLLVTMSGGASASVRRVQPLAGAGGMQLVSLHTGGNETTFELLSPLDAGSSDQSLFGADAGSSTLKTRAPAPWKRGPVDQYLENPDVSQGVQTLLAAINEGLPGYATTLDVVKNPDDGPEVAFVMVSVCMRDDDHAAWDFVEKLIDEQWLALAPHVRAALGVGREFVSVG